MNPLPFGRTQAAHNRPNQPIAPTLILKLLSLRGAEAFRSDRSHYLNNEIIIQVRGAGDDAEWLRLRLGLWPQLSAEAHQMEMAVWLARIDAVVLVARRSENRGLIGFAEVGARSVAEGCETSPVAYLEGWFVDTTFRRRGVGAALIGGAEAWARSAGYREFASDAELKNADSQRAHVALGFTEVERSVLYLKAL